MRLQNSVLATIIAFSVSLSVNPVTTTLQRDPMTVSYGFSGTRPLTPAQDLSTVTPFVAAWSAVLPESEGYKVARPCSRRAPERITDVWRPDSALIARFERELAPLLQGALERGPFSRPPAWSSGNYYRQHVGIVVEGRKIVYANGFVPSGQGGVSGSWQTQLVDACDGGARYFGAEFDVESGRVVSLAFNSEAMHGTERDWR